LALLGATAGSALDAIHTHFGATAYSQPVLWRMAWWVPLIFAGAFAIGLSRPLLERLLGRLRPAPTGSTTLLAFGIFIAAYWLSVAPLDWRLVAGLLSTIFVVTWTLWDRTLLGLAIAATAAIGGPLVEGDLVARGLFVHLHPVVIGVSGWLPFLYLCAAAALMTVAKFLVDG
jgi:hypothetical protein